MKKRSICNIHNEISDLISDLGEFMPFSSDKKAMAAILSKIRELVAEANNNAQALENRLKSYKEAIEGLGFVRDRGDIIYREKFPNKK